jgi:methionyl-tRNA synthetase
MQLAQTHLAEPVAVEFTGYPKEYTDAFERFEVNRALDFIWSRIKSLDQQITDTKPFTVVKENLEEGKRLIVALVRELAAVDLLVEPFMPETSKKIIEAILANKKPENLFPRKD